jgi:hypothetical protein
MIAILTAFMTQEKSENNLANLTFYEVELATLSI